MHKNRNLHVMKSLIWAERIEQVRRTGMSAQPMWYSRPVNWRSETNLIMSNPSHVQIGAIYVVSGRRWSIVQRGTCPPLRVIRQSSCLSFRQTVTSVIVEQHELKIGLIGALCMYKRYNINRETYVVTSDMSLAYFLPSWVVRTEHWNAFRLEYGRTTLINSSVEARSIKRS